MELTGNSASRWEQVSNKIGDIAFETDKQREQLEKLITELADLTERIRHNQEALTKLSGVVYKEVFREESKMLNDDSDDSTATNANSSAASVQTTTSEDVKPEQGNPLIAKKRSNQKAIAKSRVRKTAQKPEQIDVVKEVSPEKGQLQLLPKDMQHHEQ